MTNARVESAWERYLMQSKNHVMGSREERAAFDRYFAIVQEEQRKQ